MQDASSSSDAEEEDGGGAVKAPGSSNTARPAVRDRAGKKHKSSAGNRLAQLKDKRKGRKSLQPVRKKQKKEGKAGKGKHKVKGKR